jgi:hypothetical protein
MIETTRTIKQQTHCLGTRITAQNFATPIADGAFVGILRQHLIDHHFL